MGFRYLQTVLGDTPLAYWRLGDTIGTVARDETMNGLNASLSSTVTIKQPGAITNDPDGSMLFDGTKSTITCPSGVNPNGFTAFSVELWVKPSTLSLPSLPSVIGSDQVQTSHKGIVIYLGSAADSANFALGNGTTATLASGAFLFSTTIWTQLIGTWDGSTMTIYVNGSAIGSGAFTGPISNTNAISIGHNTAGTDYFSGAIDEVSLYPYCLTPAQVSNHYQAGTQNTKGPYSVYIGSLTNPVMSIGGSLGIDNAVGRRSSANVTVHTDNLTHFQQWTQIRVYDQSNVLAFNGYLTTPKSQKPGFQKSLNHTLSAADQHVTADRRRVAAAYANKTVGAIAQDIWANILAAEGVTIGRLYDGLSPSNTLYPGSTLYPNGGVGVIPSAIFSYSKVSEALDALVQKASQGGTAFYWMIDQYLRLWVVPYTYVIGPAVDGTTVDQKYNPPTLTNANPLYRNSQYETGGVQQTSTQTEIHLGDGNSRSFTMGYDLATVPTISVNLNGAGYTSQTVGIKGVDTGKNWYWSAGDPIITQDAGGTILRGPTGTIDLLKVVFTGQYPGVTYVQNNSQVTLMKGIIGGTGLFEDVDADASITDATTASQKASALLDLYGQQGQILEFSTLQAGYDQGQLLAVNLPDFGLSNVNMLVESVHADDSQDGLNIWYRIKAVIGPYDQTWQSFFSKLLATAKPGNISIGVSTIVNLALTATLTATPSSVNANIGVHACPIPSSSLIPSSSVIPC